MMKFRKGRLVEISKFESFIMRLLGYLRRHKLVDTWKYNLILKDDMKKVFMLSDKEYKESKMYKGNPSYEFYSAGGLGYGVQLHFNTGNTIDITDVSKF